MAGSSRTSVAPHFGVPVGARVASFVLALICLGGLGLSRQAAAVAATAFPHKPIKIIVYTAPSGPINLTARRFAEVARRYTNATFVVENKTGAGGIVAMEKVLQSRADGYTLLACTKSNVAKMVSTGREGYVQAFDWLALLMTDPECVITRRGGVGLDWRAMLRQRGQREERQIWLGPARGGLDHVTAMQIWDRFGIHAEWIPFASGDLALQSLLTEQGIAYVGNPADVVGQPDLQVSVVCNPKRLPQLPDTPTFGEFGFPDLDELSMWRGFALRKGCPDAVRQWYGELFRKVTDDPEWRGFWEKDGIHVVYRDASEFSALVESNRQEFRLYLERLDMMPTAETTAAASWFGQVGLRLLLILFLAHLLVAALLARWGLWDKYGLVVILTCLVSASLLFFWETTKFPADQGVGAAAVPRLWVTLIVILVIVALIYRPPDEVASTPGLRRMDRVARLAVLMALYVVLTVFLGYYVSSAVFLAGSMWLLGERRWPMLVGVTLLWLAFAYVMFWRLLFVPLPLGRWLESLS
jgi:tripartite-type tricarboxylate transporter receptor subunit TctC